MSITDYCRRPSGQRIHWLVALLLVWAGWTVPTSTAQQASHSPRLTFTKEFKGAVPEYVAIAVDTTGAATFEGRRLDEPSHPRPLQLSAATTSRLFELAAQLGYFHSVDLESHKAVANLGLKTFRYEKDDEVSQAQFNFTLRKEASELLDWFERIACVAQHQAALEYDMKYDHLGLPGELLQLRLDLAKKVLVDPELLVPALAQISRGSHYLNVAKRRAQDILQRIQDKP